jgi:hypothetical protein
MHSQYLMKKPPSQSPGRPLFEEPVQATRCAPDDQHGLGQQRLPLFASALLVVPVGQEHFNPGRHRLVQVVADFGNTHMLEQVELGVLAMAGPQLVQPPGHAVEHDTDGRMGLGRHGHPKRPRHALQCPGARQNGQAQRVALACARRSLDHQHVLRVVAANNGALRRGEAGGLLRQRREVGKLLSGADP